MAVMLMAVGLEGVFDPEPRESLKKHMPPGLGYPKDTEREDLKLPSRRRQSQAHPDVPENPCSNRGIRLHPKHPKPQTQSPV